MDTDLDFANKWKNFETGFITCPAGGIHFDIAFFGLLRLLFPLQHHSLERHGLTPKIAQQSNLHPVRFEVV